MSDGEALIERVKDLDGRSLYLRRLVIRAFEGGTRGHLGSSMSLIEILSVLYDEWLKYNVNEPLWSGRDRFILSKGHGCLAQYALLADKGFIRLQDLDEFCHPKGILGGHPDRNKIPGVEASTGALGHGLSIGVGVALALKLSKSVCRVVVVTGDGEINEGAVWEAAMSASKHRLDNLIWMIDYNKLQSYGRTDTVMSLEPLSKKLESFGFEVQNIDGHDKGAIRNSLAIADANAERPNAIVCHTIKGKGFPFAESNPSWHHKSKLSPEEIQRMYDCLLEEAKNA